MALVRWEPAREFGALQSDMNRLFDSFFGTGDRANATHRWVPAMDLLEIDDSLVLKADLPGMSRDDVKIEVKDGVLTVSGERKDQHEEEANGYYRVERSFGGFSRSLALPKGVEPDGIEADFSDGVLEVRIPKPAERKPHRIEIGGATGRKTIEGSAGEK